MTAELLPAVEVETGPNPHRCVIWLHGLGADGHDFVPIVKELGLTPQLPVRFVFPHAPLQPVTINGGYVMRAWYDIGYEDLTLKEDEKGVRESQRSVEALIEREMARGVKADQLVLAGFSQGGAIALQTALRQPFRLAGVLALSAYLALPDKLQAERAAANEDIPIFMGHGIEDPIVPLKLAQASCARLLELGYPVQWREYEMPHSVCEEELRDVAAWLGQIFR